MNMVIQAKKYTLISLFTLLFVAGCSSAPTVKQTENLLSNQYFPNHTHYIIETPAEIFALNQAVIEFVEQTTSGKFTDKQKVSALVYAIFDRGNLSLEYLAQANTTANQTFERGSANCLSLTIMVFSMTQHLGLEAEFKTVNIPEFWTRRGGNTLLNGHINLQIKPDTTYRNLIMSTRPIIVDFDPLQGSRKFTSRTLTKRQIVSYFYVNKAADAMIDGNSDLAYAYLKGALTEYKNNESAWLNLGVLYSRNNMIDLAEATYLKLRYSSNNNSTALENLAFLYRKTNRVAQAILIEERLEKKRVNNPYYHMMLGDIASEEKKYSLAVKHYKKSLALNNRPHEFHFKIAKAYFALGDIKNTKRYLQSAKTHAKDGKLEQKYASKLSLLASR